MRVRDGISVSMPSYRALPRQHYLDSVLTCLSQNVGGIIMLLSNMSCFGSKAALYVFLENEIPECIANFSLRY